MYYLIYIPLYLISLLPLTVLYFIGDGLYVFVYYVFGYRKKVVLANLEIAFPEKTPAERIRIAKDFYHNFIDTFMETLKFISWSKAAFEKRFQADLSGLEPAYASTKNIHLIGMHNFNWEYANWGMSLLGRYPWLGIYLPVGNKQLDRIIYNMRSKWGTILLPATDFKRHYLQYVNKRHIMGSAADQSPGNSKSVIWVTFFGRPTAFVSGAEKGARLNDAAVVFAHFYKTKRGHYRLDTEFVTATPNELPPGELTRQYVRFIERCLRKNPANYLWSHRRWKRSYQPEFGPVITD